MKVQHSTTISLKESTDARTLKLALEHIPDEADISADVRITEADRPWESRRTEVSLLAVWDTP